MPKKLKTEILELRIEQLEKGQEQLQNELNEKTKHLENTINNNELVSLLAKLLSEKCLFSESKVSNTTIDTKSDDQTKNNNQSCENSFTVNPRRLSTIL